MINYIIAALYICLAVAHIVKAKVIKRLPGWAPSVGPLLGS